MLRLFPLAALLILVVPVLASLGGVLLPAFGYFPALGRAVPSLQAFRDLIDEPGLSRSVLLSLGTGLAATAGAFTLVMAFLAGWIGTRLFAAIERSLSPLLSLPHAAAAFGFGFLIAPSGFLARLASPWATGWEHPPDLLIVQDRFGVAMTLCLVAKEAPFLFLMALAALPQVRAAETDRAVAALGYGRSLRFVFGVFPALYRQIRLPTLAVLAFSTSVVDIALILGPTTPAPLSVRVLGWQTDPDLGQRLVAAAGAALQLATTASALLVWLLLEQAGAVWRRHLAASGWRFRGDAWLRRLSAALTAASTTALFAGIGLLALWSVATAWPFPKILPSDWSIRAWTSVSGNLGDALGHSLAFAIGSSVLALVLALGLLEHQARQGREAVFSGLYLPLLVPQVSLLFGLQTLLAAIRADGTFSAVLAAHLVFVFPYVLLSLSEPWRSWDPRYGLAARALGRGPNTIFWRLRLPMLTRAILTAFAVGFAVSVALYLPTLMVGAGRWPTLTTETLALAAGGNPRLIGATALSQALLPFVAFALPAALPQGLFHRRRFARPMA
jgi:putative thiamine transport system permease protein